SMDRFVLLDAQDWMNNAQLDDLWTKITRASRPGARVLFRTAAEPRLLTGRRDNAIRGTWRYLEAISAEMLKSARAALGAEARLGEGDACAFDPQSLLGEPAFERIVLSYSLSMIPDWEGAFDHAAGQLAPGGQLHIVDFGDLGGMPGPFAAGLRVWLAKFHVTPRAAMPAVAARIAAARGLGLASTHGAFGYFQLHVLTAPPSDQ
ncbi:MAG: DUF3419 family protein, partial [Sphingomonadales bacterium]